MTTKDQEKLTPSGLRVHGGEHEWADDTRYRKVDTEKWIKGHSICIYWVPDKKTELDVPKAYRKVRAGVSDGFLRLLICERRLGCKGWTGRVSDQRSDLRKM